MDLFAIGQAIAGRFVGMTTSAGETCVVNTEGLLPNEVGGSATLLVFPPSGDLEVIMTSRCRDQYVYPVRMLFDPINVPERHRRLLQWANAMRFRVEGDMNLGLAYVAWAQAVGMRVEVGTEEYNGALYDVVELLVRVQIDETGVAISP